jgi:hypothetical protein
MVGRRVRIAMAANSKPCGFAGWLFPTAHQALTHTCPTLHEKSWPEKDIGAGDEWHSIPGLRAPLAYATPATLPSVRVEFRFEC